MSTSNRNMRVTLWGGLGTVLELVPRSNVDEGSAFVLMDTGKIVQADLRDVLVVSTEKASSKKKDPFFRTRKVNCRVFLFSKDDQLLAKLEGLGRIEFSEHKTSVEPDSTWETTILLTGRLAYSIIETFDLQTDEWVTSSRIESTGIGLVNLNLLERETLTLYKRGMEEDLTANLREVKG